MADGMKAMDFLKRILVIVLFPIVTGCAAAAISATGASLGVSYTINNMAYKTYSFPVENVKEATLQALRKMGFVVIQHLGLNERIEATAKDLKIRITLEHITLNTTQMTVNARKGPFFKDKATALEIIYQVSRILDPQVGDKAQAAGIARTKADSLVTATLANNIAEIAVA